MLDRLQRIVLVGAVFCASAGVARAQPFEPIGDVALYFGTPNAGRLSRIVPTTTDRIFASAPGGGVWRTLDGGGAWETRTDRFASLFITALAASSDDPRVFAATFSPTRLLRSTDGGNSFTEIVIPQVAFQLDAIWKIVIDPVNAQTLYAVTTRGLLRSADDGDHWVVVLPPDPAFVFDVAVLAGAEFHVLATRAGQLYRSSTGNAGTWLLVALPAPPDGKPPFPGFSDGLVLAPVPGDPARVWVAYAITDGAVYRSADYGASPVFISRHARGYFRGRVAASADGTTLYSGSPAGSRPPVLHRQVGAALTTSVVDGPYHADVWAVVTTASPPYVYIGTDGGIWRYHETTEVWENLNGDMANLLVYESRTSRSDNDAIVAGTQDNGAIVHRGRDWIIAAPTDAGDGMLRTDDPASGASFIIIAGRHFVRIDGTSGTAVAYVGERPPCSPPDAGRFALDPTDPRVVCVAGGRIWCARDPRHATWCEETADLGFIELFIVDHVNAWATSFESDPIREHVMRTTSGVFGTWDDATGDLPPGRLIGLDAPEQNNPLRALVLWRPTGDVARVYETLDGGANWTPRGAPPIPDEGGLGLECLFPPCPDTPERGPEASRFAVTFPGLLIPESWFVGTRAGLLESTNGGVTWKDTDVPHVWVQDVDTFDTIVTVGTYGRGVFRRIAEPLLPDFDFLPVDPFWHMRQVPFELPDVFASDVVAELGDLLQELRRLGGGGRRFQPGDVPHGPHDFPLTAGQPFLVRGTESSEWPIEGPPVASRPIALAPGWNAVGVLDPALQSASSLAADAAAQGIGIQAVVDGAFEQVFIADALGARGQDFGLKRTDGYWVYACGQGGVWTPGAGELDASTAAATPAGSSFPGRGQSECAGLDDALGRIGLDLLERLPGELPACLPEQEIPNGNLPVTVCGTVPLVDSDSMLDNFACDDRSLAHGCAVMLRRFTVEQHGPDHLTLSFEIAANGTASDVQGQSCFVTAKDDAAKLEVFLDVTVDPPVIDVKPLQFGSSIAPEQDGCGESIDPLIAQLVADTARNAIEAHVTVALTGLGPVCEPAVPLPDNDNDGAIDCNDGCPFDPFKIDPGVCGCGVVDDADGDQVASCTPDCNDQDPNVWNRPGVAGRLTLDRDEPSGVARLLWSRPAQPGGVAVVYDVLVSSQVEAFAQAFSCVETGDTDTSADFDEPLQPGAVAFLLVRATNGCANGLGSLGVDGQGNERFAGPCN